MPYMIITAPATSADPNYNGLNPSDVSVTNLLDDTANITVSPTSGLVTSESGQTDTFTVVLNTIPTADVTIGLSSSDTTIGTVSPSSLTFTAGNWNVPQTVTVTGADNGQIGSDTPYTIVTAPAASSDPNYNGLDPSDVSVTNLETDTRDLQVTGLSVNAGLDAGATATVQWNDADMGNVAVTQ